MSLTTRLLPGVSLLLAALLLTACGQKPARIRVKETRLKVYGLGRTVSVAGSHT